eukprot:CAMPEP_0195515262 /NCGR_PEP_ID=MMETSP0794_2-20130614/6390_1 /TAXON_ID=515487 /ORGANISM="Stephanopyxis turris, Strain CCMP 815" /LENGTH=481 /DNA_ID=CAMNT_0040643659 /DNA_START=57 /DNA_END=1502 /DNA_ORIENTATION=-
MAYARFMEAREDLNQAMKACRELIQHTVTFTRYEESERAQQWRGEIARRTIVLLRTAVSVLEYNTKGQHAWKVPELTKDEKQALLISVGKSNERTPMVLTVFLRSAIASQVEYLEKPIHVNKELRLYQFVSNFVTAYHDLMKLATTPFPFPLVQMGRTILFLWIFTLPCAIMNDVEKLPALMLIIFFSTYGFVGLEFVSIELDDPFGDDPNDFDAFGLAKVVFEDIYLAIYDIDGKQAAASLKRGFENAGTKKPGARHIRYSSYETFKTSTPAPERKIGTDRSQLLRDYVKGKSHRMLNVFGGGSSQNVPNDSGNTENLLSSKRKDSPVSDAGSMEPLDGATNGIDLNDVFDEITPKSVAPENCVNKGFGSPELNRHVGFESLPQQTRNDADVGLSEKSKGRPPLNFGSPTPSRSRRNMGFASPSRSYRKMISGDESFHTVASHDSWYEDDDLYSPNGYLLPPLEDEEEEEDNVRVEFERC